MKQKNARYKEVFFCANVCHGRSSTKTVVSKTPNNLKARKILQILDLICVFFKCVYIEWCLYYPQQVLDKATQSNVISFR